LNRIPDTADFGINDRRRSFAMRLQRRQLRGRRRWDSVTVANGNLNLYCGVSPSALDFDKDRRPKPNFEMIFDA
jgi:hypothetical protein